MRDDPREPASLAVGWSERSGRHAFRTVSLAFLEPMEATVVANAIAPWRDLERVRTARDGPTTRSLTDLDTRRISIVDISGGNPKIAGTLMT